MTQNGKGIWMVLGLLSLLLSLLLTGCASTLPRSIAAVDVQVIPLGEVRGNPSAYAGERVRWGGQVIDVENRKEQTLITILSRPLAGSGRPRSEGASDGRFIARVRGFADPAEYASEAAVTVLGRISGEVRKPVGEYPYVYPMVDVEGLHLWPPLPEREVIYYDPWFDPWYHPWWHRYPYWR